MAENTLKWVAEKADITSGTTIASAGKLNAEQLTRLLNWTMDESKLLKIIRMEPMNGPTKDLDSFSISSRNMRVGTEATAGEATTITTAKRTLTTVKTLIEYDPTTEFVEDNIAGSGGLDQVIEAFARAFANDLADLAINGDGATPSFLSINKGFIQLLKDDIGSSHLYDHNGTTDYKGVLLPNIVRAMPSKYVGNPERLKIFCSWADYRKFTEDIATRATPLGDMLITGAVPLRYAGFEIVPIPMWPDGSYIFTDPKNLVVGIQRDITLKSWEDIKKDMWAFVLTARTDFQIINIDECVLSYNA